MSTLHPDEMKTSFYETQRTIALKYAEHINTKVISFREEIINYLGFRDGKNYNGLDGGVRVDEYPYKHIGTALAMGFDFFGEDVRVELINDVNYYVIYINCQSTDDNQTEFMFEFEKNDKELHNTFSEELIELINKEEF